jgi:hypothetical protein
MIQIRNIATYRVGVGSSYMGGQGRPLYIGLGPNDSVKMSQEELKKWPNGAKEDLASYVQRGLLQVSTFNNVHIVDDKGHKLPTYTACNLGSAIEIAVGFRDVYNAHVVNRGVHSTADTGNVDITAVPTNLATLTAFITAVQGAYDTHLTQAGVHPNNDVLNATTVVPDGTLVVNLDALRELYGLFDMHKRQGIATGAAVLNPNQIIAYV